MTASVSDIRTALAEDAPGEFSERFDFANGLYARGMYAMALTEYDGLATNFAGHESIGLAALRAAECLFFLERFEEAISRYEEVIGRHATDATGETARRRMGEAYYFLGNKEKAKEVFGALFENTAHETQDIARYYSGKISYEEGDLESASGHLERVSEAEGERSLWAYATYYLGEIALANADAETALAYFEAARERNTPELGQALVLGLGRAAFKLQRYRDAAGHFQEAYRQAPNPEAAGEPFLNYLEALFALEDFQGVLDAHEGERAASGPDVETRIRFLVARTATALQDYRRANAVYDEILTWEGLSRRDEEMARMGKVEILMQLGDAATALDMIAESVAEERVFPERWSYLKADALKRAGRWEEAIHEIEAFVDAFPESDYTDKVMLNRGYVYLEKGDLELARGAFDAFIERYPDHAFAEKSLSDMILLDMKMKFWDQAIEDSRRFLKRFPKSDQARKVHYRLASLYTDTNTYDEAHAAYLDYLETYPDATEDHEIYFFMGYNRQLAGQTAGALEYYEKINPEKVKKNVMYTTLKNQAYCHVLLEQFDRASTTYEKLITMFPENDLNPEIYFWLADHYREGENAAAIRSLMEKFRVREDSAAHEASAAYFVGESYRLERQCAEALSHYASAIDGGVPFGADVFFAQALCQREIGDFDAADVSFREALNIAGEDHEITIRSRLELAALEDFKGNPLAAAKGYLSVGILYDDPRWVPEALSKAGAAFRKAERPKDAERVLRELIERFPDHPLAKDASQRLHPGGA